MSNSVTPQVVAQVEAVLADKKKNRYSTSGIYAAHNAVFNKNEAPQSCASCLKKRAEALEKWYNALELTAVVNVGENPKGARPAEDAELHNEEAKAGVDEAQDFDLMDVTNKKGEAFKIKFVTVEGDTGTVTQADGKALNAGTYSTKDGDTLAVQPGGKATLKSNLL